MRVELDVEALAPGLEQVWPVATAEDGAHNPLACPAAFDGDAHEVGEVARAGLLGLGDLNPALLRHRGGVDVVDLLLGVAGEHAVEDGDRQQAVVALGDAAEELDLDAVDRAAFRERRPDAPELLAQRQERTDRLPVLDRDGGDVDGGRDHPAGQGGDDLLGGLLAGAVGGLGGRRAEVRRDNHVRVPEQRMVGDRLGTEDVERRAAHLAAVERGLQVLVDDERAAGHVEDAHPVAHLRERLGVQPALGLGRVGQVDGDEVGAGVELVGALGALDAEIGVALAAHIGVIRDDTHAEAARPLRHQLADPPEADDAQRLVVELDARQLGAVPPARTQRRVGLRDVARERQQQRHRVLGRRDDVGLRRVGHDDAALGGRGHVDVVDPHPGTADDP